MPVKRRAAKRRVSPEAECEAWARLGARWLRDWHDRAVKPWAVEQFGLPPGADHAS